MENDLASSSICKKVIGELKNEILKGTLKYGNRLPTEKWLCSSYGVSRTTIRKVLDVLLEDNFVERRSNRGVYVSYTNLNSNFDRPTSMFQRMVEAGITPSSKILSFNRIPANSSLADIFGCSSDETFSKIHRIRYADGIPFAEQFMYLPETLFHDFDPWRLSTHSFYTILMEEYGYKIDHSIQTVHAAMASKAQASYLNIAIKSPLLHTKSTLLISGDRVAEYQETFAVTSIVPYTYLFVRSKQNF